jgi:hypothetical protein
LNGFRNSACSIRGRTIVEHFFWLKCDQQHPVETTGAPAMRVRALGIIAIVGAIAPQPPAHRVGQREFDRAILQEHEAPGLSIVRRRRRHGRSQQAPQRGWRNFVSTIASD